MAISGGMVMIQVQCPKCREQIEISTVPGTHGASESTPIHRVPETVTYEATVQSPEVVRNDVVTQARPSSQQPVLGDYELMDRIGSGGMGVVYRAVQRSANRVVALKVIRPERLDDHSPEARADIIRRFHTEAEAAARLEHDHIVTVYEVGESAGQHFYSMRFIDGQSLAAMVREGPLASRRAASYLEPVARAVHAAHRHGVLHRDLKPRNILVDAADRPYVADFGLAKWLERASDVTRTGQVLGTPEYMSPEQAQDASRCTASSDVYSLGATLYDLVTTRPPFRAASVAETLRQVVHEDPVPPRRLNPEIDRDLETITLKCLEKDPARRYASAAALAEDLRRYGQREPVLARPVSLAGRFGRWARRNPVITQMAAALILAVVAGFGLVSWKWREAAQQTVQLIQAQSTILSERNAAIDAWKQAESSAINARRAGERADGINRFLIRDMLALATPEEALGHKITVEEVLSQAARKIEGAFQDDPEIEGNIRVTIATTLQKLGRAAESEAHARIAVDKLNQALGADHTDTLRARGSLVAALYSAGKLSEADNESQESLEAVRRLSTADPKTLAGALANRASVMVAIDRALESEPLWREAIRVATESLGDEHDVTIQSAVGLSIVLRRSGRSAEALPVLIDTFDASKRRFGDEHPQTLSVMNSLALTLGDLKRHTEACDMLKRCIELQQRILGAKHPETLRTMSNYGLALKRQRKLVEAESILQETLALRRETLTEEHPDTLTSMNNLAGVLHDQQKHEAAEDLFRRVVDGRRRVLGNDHGMTVTAIQNLADVLIEHGKPVEAEPFWKEAYDTSKRLSGPDDSGTMFSLQRYSQTLANLGRHAEAEPLLRQAVDYDRNHFGATHEGTMVVEGYLAISLQALGKFDEAELLLRRSIDARLEALGPSHRSSLIAQHNLAALLADCKKYEESDRLFDAVAKVKRETMNPNDPSLATTLSRWAKMRLLGGDAAGAIPLFRESLAILARISPSHPGFRGDSLGLATALVRTGELEEAERIARDVTEKSRRQFGTTHRATASAELVLGECLVANRAFEEAESLLLRAYESLRDAAGTPNETLAAAGEHIVKLYELWGKPDLAEEWRSKRPRQ